MPTFSSAKRGEAVAVEDTVDDNVNVFVFVVVAVDVEENEGVFDMVDDDVLDSVGVRVRVRRINVGEAETEWVGDMDSVNVAVCDVDSVTLVVGVRETVDVVVCVEEPVVVMDDVDDNVFEAVNEAVADDDDECVNVPDGVVVAVVVAVGVIVFVLRWNVAEAVGEWIGVSDGVIVFRVLIFVTV